MHINITLDVNNQVKRAELATCNCNQISDDKNEQNKPTNSHGLASGLYINAWFLLHR